MVKDISKKEVAAMSVALASYLSRSQSAEGSPSASEMGEVLESLVERVAELEKKVAELSSAMIEKRKK